MSAPTFDEVVCGAGDTEERFSFREFVELPLSRRVELLMRSPRYYRDGELLNGSQVMQFR